MTDVSALLARIESRLQPLDLAVAEAWWESNADVSEETEARRIEAETAHRAALADTEDFADVVSALEHLEGDRESIIRRQLEVLHSEMGPNQVPDDLRSRLTELEARVDSIFSAHRGEIDGRRVDDNDVLEILTGSDDGALRRRAWEASKAVGGAVAALVLDLVAVRNEIAVRLGYGDHYAASLAFDELDEARLFATLDDVERVTDAPFTAWKSDLDAKLAARFGCDVSDLRSWHYDDPFFQDVPQTGRPSIDALVASADLEALTVQTYEGCGLDVRPSMNRSDLYPRERKNQHAFCISIDRADDVRVLCNIVPNERWTDTMLHEFGHAIYDLEIERSLPFRLRQPAHSLTTEAVAMMFGRLARDPAWLRDVAGAATADVDGLADGLAEARRAQLLVFARWALVMCHFERGLYRDPAGDHDTRWWDLVERFQLVTRPDDRAAPDWAAKIHLAVAPVYYQNYLYGELFASQLQASLARDCGGVVGRADAGAWLSARVFRPGASQRWDHLVESATGAPLGTDAWTAELAQIV